MLMRFLNELTGMNKAKSSLESTDSSVAEISDSFKHIFHGACIGCVAQKKNGVEYCVNCKYFEADWNKADLSDDPKEKAMLRLKEDIKRRKNVLLCN